MTILSSGFHFRPLRTRLAVAVLAAALGTGCGAAARQRIHDENMTKAAVFELAFDAQLASGASLASVDAYLTGKPVKATRSLGYRDGRDFVKELLIEVASERSVHWYCGRSSVGVIAEFNEGRLTGTRVSSWSMDCL